MGLLLACARGAPRDGGEGGTATGRKPLFREIDLGPHGRVALDAPFAQRDSAVAVPLGEGVYALVGGRGWSFADTDSILVALDAARRVRALRFVYQAGKDYAAAAAEYEASLGAPHERGGVDSAGARIERVAWQDERTRFELRRVTPRASPPRVSSILTSRYAGP